MNNVLILLVNTINKKKHNNRIIITIGYKFYTVLGKRIINNNMK